MSSRKSFFFADGNFKLFITFWFHVSLNPRIVMKILGRYQPKQIQL